MKIPRNVYIGIGIVGILFSLFTFIVYDEHTTFTSIFLFMLVILLMKLQEEYFFYRSFNAPLSTGIFLLIPSTLMLTSSFIARHPVWDGQGFLSDGLLGIDIGLSFLSMDNVYIFLNSFSVIFSLVFYVIVLVLMYRYYTGIYTRIFIFKKKFYKQFAMYFNIGLMVVIGYFWISFGNMLLFEVIFVITSVFLILNTYVFKIVFMPVRILPINRGRRQNRSRNSSPTLTRNNPGISRHPARSTGVSTPRRNSIAPARPSNPSIVPGRSNNSQSSAQILQARRRNGATSPNTRSGRNNQSGQRRRGSPADVQVIDGIQLESRQTPTASQSGGKKNIQEFVPIAQNLTKDDFRCIFCYEIPDNKKDNVVICPNCRKPAHDHEYRQWSSLSTICSYCNKDVGGRSPRRISGKNYAKVVKMALKS